MTKCIEGRSLKKNSNKNGNEPARGFAFFSKLRIDQTVGGTGNRIQLAGPRLYSLNFLQKKKSRYSFCVDALTNCNEVSAMQRLRDLYFSTLIRKSVLMAVVQGSGNNIYQAKIS